jgi:hypothetical protein
MGNLPNVAFSVILNRIGLMLNFLAAILLTPEIIGIERIQKAQCQLEKRLKDSLFMKKLRSLQEKSKLRLWQEKKFNFNSPDTFELVINTSFLATAWSIEFLILATLIFTVPEYRFLWLGIILLLTFLTYFQTSLYDIVKIFAQPGKSAKNKISEVVHKIKISLSDMFYMTLIGPILLALNYRFFAKYMAMSVTIKVLGFVTNILNRQGRLQFFIIMIGLLLFITGTICQFLATY